MPFRSRLAGALLAALLVSGALPAEGSGSRPEAPARAGTSLRSGPPELSRAQLAGQRVIYSYRGLTPPATLVARIRAGEAAGVIFFADNISSPAQLRGVIARLQGAAAHSPVKVPLLMMTDQEGGLVRRLPGAPVPSEKQIGTSRTPLSAAARAGRGAGLNLAGAGINVNLAPVLDVYRSPGDFIDLYGRSYSRDPTTVARLGAAFISAQQGTGVAATAKHFPGLGAAARTQNTDEVPATLNVALRALRSLDELPYVSAVRTGVRLVMVSWARYPALDSRRPAGLSSAVVQRELRGRLHFRGVTITDALGAGALRSYGPTSNRAVLAASAGMDLLLCSARQVGEGAAAVGALAAALGKGRLASAPFLASVDRVLSLRSALARQ